MILTYFFKLNISNDNISQTVSAEAKMSHMTFTYFDICHRMEPCDSRTQ